MRPTIEDTTKINDLRHYGEFAKAAEHEEQFDWSTKVTGEKYSFGLQNSFSQWIVTADFEGFQLPTEGFLDYYTCVAAQKGGKWGVLVADGHGDWILAPDYDAVFFHDKFVVVLKDGKYGVLELSTHDFIVEPRQDLINGFDGVLFKNGVGSYESNGKFGVFNENGQVTEPIFDDFEITSGIVRVLYDGVWGYI